MSVELWYKYGAHDGNIIAFLKKNKYFVKLSSPKVNKKDEKGNKKKPMIYYYWNEILSQRWGLNLDYATKEKGLLHEQGKARFYYDFSTVFFFSGMYFYKSLKDHLELLP